MSKPFVSAPMALGFPWVAMDPFLFCVHHLDAYPKGNANMGPAASLAGRHLGQDFEGIDGWRMYHGQQIPGFPQHPHRGFETITVARQGYIDHSDSLGATARFGAGDVQWMTAGKGIVHAEMFPLVNQESPNPLELFQIWINLPKASKFVDPYFTMFWSHMVPVHKVRDKAGRETEVTMVAGALDGAKAPQPPPNSWAARPEGHVALWTIRMAPKAEWTLPTAPADVNRMLYFFKGRTLSIDPKGAPKPTTLGDKVAVQLRPDAELTLKNGPEPTELLLLQGRPIGEPVAQYGPFVMNTKQEIQQAMIDYQRTRFGGWPWRDDAPVHERKAQRFAKHADGKVEQPKKAG